MKNILIGGTCRSGKSLLAKALKQRLPNYNCFSIDHIRNSLCDTFNKDFRKAHVDELKKFTFNLYKENLKLNKHGVYNIFEGIYMTQEEILQRYNTNENLIIFVGRPDLTPKQAFKDIREKEKLVYSWTIEHSDEELMQMVKNYRIQDKKNLKFCQQNNFLFINTSYNQLETIEKCAEEIAELMNGDSIKS